MQEILAHKADPGTWGRAIKVFTETPERPGTDPALGSLGGSVLGGSLLDFTFGAKQWKSPEEGGKNLVTKLCSAPPHPF